MTAGQHESDLENAAQRENDGETAEASHIIKKHRLFCL